MKVLVVIVAYNFERWLDRCLGSVRQSEARPDVVVIDNGSTDDTAHLIAARYPEVRLIEAGQNLGFGKANNIGMRIAVDEGYDAVYLLNQDAWLFPDTLGTLCGLILAHPQLGILSPVHLDSTGKHVDKGFAKYAQAASSSDNGSLQPVVELPFVNAAHWLIPVKVLHEVGGFSPLFHMYGEDVDLTNRMKHFGYHIGYAPNVFAVHDRAERQVSQALLCRTRYVYLLSQYANVNLSRPMAFAYSVLAGLKSMAQALLKGSFADAKMYAEICVQLMGQTRHVLDIRKLTAHEGMHFL